MEFYRKLRLFQCKGLDFTLCDPWGHTFLTALIISGVTFDGHFPLAFTSPSVLHPYVCVARTYIPGHTHLGVTQEVSLTLWGGQTLTFRLLQVYI